MTCTRCGSPLSAGDLRCAVCALPCPPPPEGESPYRSVARVLRCEGCGAALTYDVHAQAPRCAFCGSVAHLEESEDPIEEAEGYLPFTVAPDAARDALRAWLGSLGWFRPDDLASDANVDTLTPLWWVGWTFDVEALVSWTADSDFGSRRSDWAPHSGQTPMSLRASLVSASRGLSETETRRLAPGYALESATERPHAMEGAQIERFDVQRSAARLIVQRALEAQAASRAREAVPGHRVRNVHSVVLPKRLTTRRWAFPCYVLAYRYRDRLYRAVVHGQNPRLVFGDAPYSLAKILSVVVPIALAIAALVAYVLLRR
ncbi:MAG: zinc ribbon domain-containing protein [Sandaracinus sp.]|nr:zinc ribbon domain-containing protein [Sandaracinus sp.]MCB9622842.1 zinc ribbon domain-containing protein [Sandaracinus sp.]